MLDIAERLFVDWLVPDDKRDDDTYLLKLCGNRSRSLRIR